MEPITNRVADSEIEVFNLEKLWDGADVAELDITPFLYERLILKEKKYRADVGAHDWAQYEGRHVAVYCAADAIVPVWAYMLVATKLDGIARSVAFGRAGDLIRDYYTRALAEVDWSRYEGRPVVVKGCGGDHVPVGAYLEATLKLQGVARKIMFGEPCSSVPLWRRPKPAGERRPATPVGVKKPDLPSPSAS